MLEHVASPPPATAGLHARVGQGKKAGGRHQVLLSLRLASPTSPGGNVAGLAGAAAAAPSAIAAQGVTQVSADAFRSTFSACGVPDETAARSSVIRHPTRSSHEIATNGDYYADERPITCHQSKR